MKKKVVVWVAFTLLLFICMPPGFASSDASEDDIIRKFKASYPKIRLDSIAPSPIEGVFEIISGSKLAYYYPPKDILIVGSLIQNGKNISNERIITLQSEKVETIPLEKALKIGNGKYIVIEFTDPDCSFCRKAFEYFNVRQDVTKYVFFLPLARLHPQAQSKARYVLDAQDKGKAYKEVMGGLMDNKDFSQQKFSDKANTLLSEQMNIAAGLGINSTPTFWIDGQYVPGADIRRFNQILGEGSKETINKGEGN